MDDYYYVDEEYNLGERGWAVKMDYTHKIILWTKEHEYALDYAQLLNMARASRLRAIRLSEAFSLADSTVEN